LQVKKATRPIQHAVLTRIHSIERPFLNGYLTHYLDTLGYERMFIIHGENADPAWLKSWVAESGYADRVELLFPEPLGNVDEVMIRYVPMLEPRCEWVQIADIDEYIYLGGKKIDETMAQHEALKEVHWRWLMMPSDAKNPAGYDEITRTAAVFPKKFTKTIFRPPGVKWMSTHQTFWAKTLRPDEYHIHEIRNPTETACFMFHFCARGLFDILLKSLRQRFATENPKSADTEMMRRFLERHGDVADPREVPTRFLVLMIQMKEDRSDDLRAAVLRQIARSEFGHLTFDRDLLTAMLDEALAAIDVPSKTRRDVLDGTLLTECLARVGQRFWKREILPELKSLNYIKTIRKMRGEPY
jgi:hypothetical protein